MKRIVKRGPLLGGAPLGLPGDPSVPKTTFTGSLGSLPGINLKLTPRTRLLNELPDSSESLTGSASPPSSKIPALRGSLPFRRCKVFSGCVLATNILSTCELRCQMAQAHPTCYFAVPSGPMRGKCCKGRHGLCSFSGKPHIGAHLQESPYGSTVDSVRFSLSS